MIWKITIILCNGLRRQLFRGTEWSPENEGTLEDALDYLAFSHFKVWYL